MIKKIVSINKQNGVVLFDDNSTLTLREFREKFRGFLDKRIAAETVVMADMERFMSRLSSKNLSQLVKSKKLEGYLEGSMDQFLSKGQKIALATISTIIVLGIIGLVVLNQQGMLDF